MGAEFNQKLIKFNSNAVLWENLLQPYGRWAAKVEVSGKKFPGGQRKKKNEHCTQNWEKV